MLRTYGVILVATLITNAPLQGQESTTPEGSNAIAQWFKRNNISIRKTFNGSRSENKPAAVTWVDDSSKEDKQFYLVDLAVKVKEWEFVKKGNSSFLLYPVLEWHRNSQSEKETNRLSGSLRAEYRPFGLAGFSPENERLPPLVPEQVLRTASPMILAAVGYSEDFEKKEDEVRGSIFLSVTSNKRGLPGADFRSEDGTFRGRYYPYIGIERFEPTINEVKTSVEFLTARIYFEYWLVASLTRQYLQFLFDYTYRDRIGGEGFFGESASELSLGLNLYLDGKGNIAIGYEYVEGEDPKNAFLDRDLSTVALKLKF